MLTPGSVTAVLTSTGRQAFLDWTLGSSSNTAPPLVWLGLCLSIPGDNDRGDTIAEIPELWDDPSTPDGELTTTGYARASYLFGAMPTDGKGQAWMSMDNGGYCNTREIVFPEADGSWPNVNGWAMLDAAAGGTLLAYGPTNLTVESGDQVVIPEGSLVLATLPLVV